MFLKIGSGTKKFNIFSVANFCLLEYNEGKYYAKAFSLRRRWHADRRDG
jgi:hypothetical protein